MGSGVGLSIHAPIKIATDNTSLAMPEADIGYFTDVGAAYFLPRLKGNASLGLYLALTGRRLKGKELVTWGVATHYVPKENLEDLK